MKPRQVENVYSAINAIMSGESAMSVQDRTRKGPISMDWWYAISGALTVAQHTQIEQSTLEQLQAYSEWIDTKTGVGAV
jgi:hypothetical protein